MAYNAITDSQIGRDAIVDSTLMQRLRDNPIAIAQGLANAPRVDFDAALQDSIATDTVKNTGLSTSLLTEEYSADHQIYAIKFTNGEYEDDEEEDYLYDTNSVKASLNYTFNRSGVYGFGMVVIPYDEYNSTISLKLYNGNTLLCTKTASTSRWYTHLGDWQQDYQKFTFAKGDVFKATMTGGKAYKAQVIVYSSNPYDEPCGIGQSNHQGSGPIPYQQGYYSMGAHLNNPRFTV